MGKVVNQLGQLKGELNVSQVGPYLVEQVGKGIVSRCGRGRRARPAVTEKIATEPEVTVFSGQRAG
jgi:hypothetical protein